MGLGSLERRIDLVLHKSKATTVKFLREHLLAESAYTNQIVDDPRKASHFVEQYPGPVAEVLGEDMTKAKRSGSSPNASDRDWWWNTQKKLPTGAVVAPIILASDKTSLTKFQGNKTAWPVYLTLGNIAKEKWRQVSSNATVLHGQLLQAGVDRNESEREVRLQETLANLQRIFPGVRGRAVRPVQAYRAEEKTAIDCIEYMRNQRSGQATFIPLDTIQVKPVNDKYRAFAKGVRLAVDVIVSEGAVERAIHHACGNALVCDTMESARYVCYEKGQEVKPVTLEGTVIHKSGLITGGRSTRGMGRSGMRRMCRA
ncbi:putative structural maintenance of chromosomes protein [Lyophyllum shimeji]|uniref:Structural maintenance of chromosomes protein n=1 Tax=Lyophyllum shimeji TaxID=47721 RepID=A0A9P3PVS0_LYOSH|nr:putative structural maintenance of chromosomes protein [Lyophyllum shimeji]